LSRHLHIVCLDTPCPADYGGAIDMFYKIKALHKAGVEISLHYFSYGKKGNPNELNGFCKTINTYERKVGLKGFSLKQPYIVSSRVSDELVKNLQKDNDPVLLEGIHCTAVLDQLDLNNRKVMVRLHNDEADYYKALAHNSSSLLKKLYYRFESRLLHKYEHNLPKGPVYAAIAQSETFHFKNGHGIENVIHIPAFTPYHQVTGEEGIGNFCLYHGNLSVPENEKAATWLLTKVFSKIKVPFVIAGKNPSRRLDKLAHLCQHTCLVANPSETEINDLVRKAHINILPSFSSTGIKLKLLHALFEGRHCVVNDAMIDNTDLESTCHRGSNAAALASIIVQLRNQPFTGEEITIRQNVLNEKYDNDRNARIIIQHLW